MKKKKKKSKRKLNKLGKISLGLIVIVFFIGVVIGYQTLFGSTKKTAKKDNNEKSSEKVEEVEEPKPPEEKRMSIVMVGDALLHSGVYNAARKSDGTYDFSSMFTYLEPIIKNYDLRYYNQETIIGGGKPSSYPRFNSPDAIGKNLVNIGFNLVSLANNHSLDKNESGLVYSLNFWKQQTGVKTAGSYSSFEERDNIPIYEQNGIKYAFLAYTVGTNGLTVPSGKDYYLNVYSDELAQKNIIQARNNGAEVVIVSMHWGTEYTHTPTNEQRKIAAYLSSLGVDLIIGSHPHVVQPIEYVNNTLVIYSLGNLISTQRSLGLNKVIGLLVGTDIVVKDYKVTFENTNFELLYTYYTSAKTNFKVIPFKNLNNNLLSNYQSTNTKYRKIVDPKGQFGGI